MYLGVIFLAHSCASDGTEEEEDILNAEAAESAAILADAGANIGEPPMEGSSMEVPGQGTGDLPPSDMGVGLPNMMGVDSTNPGAMGGTDAGAMGGGPTPGPSLSGVSGTRVWYVKKEAKIYSSPDSSAGSAGWVAIGDHFLVDATGDWVKIPWGYIKSSILTTEAVGRVKVAAAWK
jgi:hypothetical protein